MIEIEKLLSLNDKSLDDFKPMPQPSNSEMAQFRNSLLASELNYDMENLAGISMILMSSLTTEQKSVYGEIVNSEKHQPLDGIFKPISDNTVSISG